MFDLSRNTKATILRAFNVRRLVFFVAGVYAASLFLMGVLWWAHARGYFMGLSAFFVMDMASFLVISSNGMRYLMLHRGWSGVSLRELTNLSHHLRPNGLLRDIDTDLHDPIDGFRCLEPRAQVALVVLARKNGMVAWSDVRHALRHLGASGRIFETWFLSGIDQPATPEQWEAACDEHVLLDALSDTVSSKPVSRRL